MKTKMQRISIAIVTILLAQGVIPSSVSYARSRSSEEAGSLSLPEGRVGQSYEYQMHTEGGLAPLKWRVVRGELPPGVNLDPSGKLIGVPTTPRQNSYSFAVEVSDSSPTPQDFVQPFLLMVRAAPLRIVLDATPLKIMPPSQRAAGSPLQPPIEGEPNSAFGRQRSVRVASDRAINSHTSEPTPTGPSPAARSNRNGTVEVAEPPADDPPAPPSIRTPVEGSRFVYGTAKAAAEVRIFVQKTEGAVDETHRQVWDGTADDKGKFAAELDNPLIVGWYVSALQIVANVKSAMSDQQEVKSTLYDWGRVRAYLTADVIFSKERDQFSQQDIGITFNLDKNWFWGKKANFNTFFEASLTAIPVNATDAVDQSLFLESKKAALLQGGAYLPLSLDSWIWNFQSSQNALFIAPIAKIGFQTITDAQQTTESIIFGKDDVFHFGSYGVRLGHFKLSGSPDAAHELISYIDMTTGKWENFEVVNAKGERESQRRYAFEGRLKIPATPLLIGFDANLGKGKDDLRFVFGTRFDIGELFGKLKFLQQR